MKLPIFRHIIVLAGLLVSLSCFGQAGGELEKRILVLHSMEANRPLQVNFNNYLREELNRQMLDPYVLYIENLDLVHFNEKAYKQELKQILIRKYSDKDLDLVI